MKGEFRLVADEKGEMTCRLPQKASVQELDALLRFLKAAESTVMDYRRQAWIKFVREAAMAIECPTCGANPGEDCLNLHELRKPEPRRVPVQRLHDQRNELAIRTTDRN